jgi:hypothetical protein
MVPRAPMKVLALLGSFHSVMPKTLLQCLDMVRLTLFSSAVGGRIICWYCLVALAPAQ